MHLLILTQTFPLSPSDSTAHFMYDFAQGFVEIGHEVTVVLPLNQKLKAQSFKNIHLNQFRYVWPDFFHLLGYGRTLKNDQKIPLFVYLLSPFYFLFGTITLYQEVKRSKPDIINAHWILPNGFIAAVVSKLTKIPLIITLAGSDVYISRQNFFFFWMAKFASSQAKKIISNSPQLLKDLEVKGETISYGVPENKGKRKQKNKLSMATAGRRVEKKGFERLKRIVPEVEIITGMPIRQFRQKLLSVDIFIAYSIRDSFGNLDDASLTVLEAMAASCAVIATDFPGYRNMIKHGYNGFLFDPNNKEEFLSILNRLKESSGLRRRVGFAARKTVRDSFTPKTIAQAHIKLFESFIS